MTELNLKPPTLDLGLYAGDGVRFRLVVTDKEGQAVPLIGTVTAQIRAKRSDSTSAEDFSVDMTDSDQGVAVLSLTGSQTRELVANGKFSGYWDIEWAATQDQPRTLVQGKLECDLDVSH